MTVQPVASTTQPASRDQPPDAGTPRALVVDYGGVLTNPLAETFANFGHATGLTLEEMAGAMAHAAQRHGAPPMADLETARISERVFLDRLESALLETTGRVLDLGNFRDLWFAARTTNEPFVAYLQTVRERGHRLALLTNNVIEWELHWRATIPDDDLFSLIVNSAEEGVRKPDPEIYTRTLERLGLPGRVCLFVDDVEENCVAAEQAGMPTVQFKSTEQAIADVELWLARSEAHAGSNARASRR